MPTILPYYIMRSMRCQYRRSNSSVHCMKNGRRKFSAHYMPYLPNILNILKFRPNPNTTLTQAFFCPTSNHVPALRNRRAANGQTVFKNRARANFLQVTFAHAHSAPLIGAKRRNFPSRPIEFFQKREYGHRHGPAPVRIADKDDIIPVQALGNRLKRRAHTFMELFFASSTQARYPSEYAVTGTSSKSSPPIALWMSSAAICVFPFVKVFTVPAQ